MWIEGKWNLESVNTKKMMANITVEGSDLVFYDKLNKNKRGQIYLLVNDKKFMIAERRK